MKRGGYRDSACKHENNTQQTSARLKNKTVRWRTTRYFLIGGRNVTGQKAQCIYFRPRPQQTRTDESCDESKCTTAPDLHVLGHSLVIGTTTIASTYSTPARYLSFRYSLGSTDGGRLSAGDPQCYGTVHIHKSKKKKRATSNCIDAKDYCCSRWICQIKKGRTKTRANHHPISRRRPSKSFPFFLLVTLSVWQERDHLTPH